LSSAQSNYDYYYQQYRDKEYEVGNLNDQLTEKERENNSLHDKVSELERKLDDAVEAALKRFVY